MIYINGVCLTITPLTLTAKDITYSGTLQYVVLYEIK